jgi:hypothetical protein
VRVRVSSLATSRLVLLSAKNNAHRTALSIPGVCVSNRTPGVLERWFLFSKSPKRDVTKSTV